MFRPVLHLLPTNAHDARVLGNQALFLGTGLVSTLGAQSLFYKGAADAQSMLTILSTYVGMVAIALIPVQNGKKSRNSAYSPLLTEDSLMEELAEPRSEPPFVSDNIPHKAMITVALLDVFATIVLTIGLFFVGSGLYQVIYSSVIVFTALQSRVFLNRTLSGGQWLAVFTITAGLSMNAFQSDTGGDIHGSFGSKKDKNAPAGVFAGFLITLAGTALYAGVYTLNDFVLSSNPSTESILLVHKLPPTPRQQCFWVGTYSSAITLLLMILYSLPHLAHMPLNDLTVVGMYGVLILSSLGHNLAYFELVESTGAVATGILQALRAVLVFALSHYFFCERDGGQCYTAVKGWATVVVVTGVVGFAFAKARMKHRDHHKVPSFDRGLELHEGVQLQNITKEETPVELVFDAGELNREMDLNSVENIST
ncbi:hypothetical protein HK098_003014 [Nowakowskiella sp. JEL0407]|nr:hypothetical protein HK098_003014 [Nowakowskiella sp. JEL0407]